MSTPVIQLGQLVRTYKTGEVEVKAVRGVTLDIHRGEFVAIMGSSGSGKSTLMNTIGCLDQPTSGTYLLDGVAVADLDRKQLANCAAFCSSWTRLNSDSAFRRLITGVSPTTLPSRMTTIRLVYCAMSSS